MNIQKKNITKLCSFYVSDWHLVTMLLPYINRKINEEEKIVTVLENNISNNVEVLVQKLNLKNEEKILNINWSNKNNNYSDFNNYIKEAAEKNITIIVNGTKEFIDEANKNIEKIIEDNKENIEAINIKIINCYEIVEFNGSIVEILDKHDKILNTSGEREINEIFEDYKRSEKIG